MNTNTTLKKWTLICAAGCGGFLATLCIFLWLIYFMRGTFIESMVSIIPHKSLQGVNVLVVGTDVSRVVQRSDTLIVLHLDKIKNRIGVLSIPRDTRAHIPGFGVSKINHAYAHGEMPLLVETVSSFLNIPINYYVKVNLDGLEDVVDKLGGIPVDIRKDLNYIDHAGGLHINFSKGKQVLNGKQSKEYLRFRHDRQGDIGRISRQQSFIRAVANKVIESGMFKSTRLLKSLSELIDTNLTIRETMGLARQFSQAYKQDNIKTGVVPGVVVLINGVSYWRPDIVAMDKMMDSTLFGFGETQIMAKHSPVRENLQVKHVSQTKQKSQPEKETQTVQKSTEKNLSQTKKKSQPEKVHQTVQKSGSPKKQVIQYPIAQVKRVQLEPVKLVEKSKEEGHIKTPDKEASKEMRRHITLKEVSRITKQANPQDEVIKKGAKEMLKIEVLNGNGIDGAAKAIVKALRKNGFNIVRFENSGSFNYDKSLIVDWKNNVQNSLVVANELQIDPKGIIVYDRPQKTLDLTIVIGKDWKTILERLVIK